MCREKIKHVKSVGAALSGSLSRPDRVLYQILTLPKKAWSAASFFLDDHVDASSVRNIFLDHPSEKRCPLYDWRGKDLVETITRRKLYEVDKKSILDLYHD